MTAAAFLELVAGRRGHFRLESGLHGALWLDLDSLFAQPRRVEPFVASLTQLIRPHGVSAVCGPLLGGAFLAQLVARGLDVEFWFTERTVRAADSDGLFRARYRLPVALRPRVRDRRVAIVDDVMSAGSALRGTFAELAAHGARPAVAGALLVLGTKGAEFFAEQGVAVEAVARDAYEMWLPDECPLCRAGSPLEDVAAPDANEQPLAGGSGKVDAAGDVTVRQATPADVDAIVRLGLEVQALHAEARPDLFKPGVTDPPEEILARIASADHFYWVAVRGGGVVGYAYARVVEEPETRWHYRRRTLLVDQMSVGEGHQGRGVGRRLWAAVRGAGEAARVDRVILNVWAFNARAQRFYERLGLTPFNGRMALELGARGGGTAEGRGRS